MEKKTWKDHPARAIILADLVSCKLTLNEEEMSAEAVYNDFYKGNGIIHCVVFKDFKKRLKNARIQTMNNLQKTPKKDVFKWRKSESKCLLLEDLKRGILSLEPDANNAEEVWKSYHKDLPENEGVSFESFKERLEKKAMSAEQAWTQHYKFLPAFKEVKFDQFKARLHDHRKQMKNYLIRSMKELWMLREDRKRFPPKTRKADGTLIFASTPARNLLRDDIADMKHKKMTPKSLQATRVEYKDFTLKIFTQAIGQNKRRHRFCNHLSNTREKKKKIHSIKPRVGLDDNTMEERLKVLSIERSSNVDEAEVEQVDEDEVEVSELDTFVVHNNTLKRQINSDSSPNKKQRMN